MWCAATAVITEGHTKTLGWGLHKYLGKPGARHLHPHLLLSYASICTKRVKEVTSAKVFTSCWPSPWCSALGWFAIGMVYVVEAAFLRRYDITVEDNVRARQVHTQMVIFRRMTIGFLLILTAGAVLWTFHDERIWKAGTGLIASAGIASLILAAAAKSTASNFLAGIQIALTAPIRIDDVVVVQGEWGRIEEITSAYVVIKIWDQRRLIVPLTYFIENSFANWTRQSAEIMGTAFLYVDYTIPVEALRAHLQTVAANSPLWDKRVCGLQVTDLREHTMEIRCLISSRNSSENFDLRCIVREEMVASSGTTTRKRCPTSASPASRSSRAGSQTAMRLRHCPQASTEIIPRADKHRPAMPDPRATIKACPTRFMPLFS